MVAKLGKVMHDFIMLSGWKKSIGAFVSLESVHNYGGLAPTQILNLRILWIFHITIPNIHFCDEQTQRKFQVLTQKESLISWKLSQIAQTQKQNFIEVNLLENIKYKMAPSYNSLLFWINTYFNHFWIHCT